MNKTALNFVHRNTVFKRRVRVLSDIIVEQLGSGDSVVDIGCGDGSISRAIMDKNPQAQITGLDILKRPETLIPVEIFDGVHVPMPDNSVDWALLIDVLHHDTQPETLLREASRVARVGVIVKDHLSRTSADYWTLRFMDLIGNWGHDVRLVYNYQSPEAWNDLFQASHLDIAKWVDRVGLYPAPFSAVFDRSLHFVATLRPAR